MKVFYEDKLTAMKFLFFVRDREEGLGERRTFRVIIKHLASVEPEIIKAVCPVIAEYGRYDDLLELFDTPLEEYVICELLGKQLLDDTNNYLDGKPISLLAKWLPSINASSKVQRARAKKIISHMKNANEKVYRQTLAKLREHIDVTERKMCANEWGKIKYENVPSRANLNYNAAFLRHDEERRRAFLGKVEKGEAKIHAGKLYPHDIVHKYTGGDDIVRRKDTTLEELWKALPQKEIANTLVVADGSGSMTNTIGNTNVTALDVANALAIYFAEHNKGEFNNTYITFSETPQLVKFDKGASLHDKIAKCLLYDEVATTNIEAVFDLILDTAINNNLKQEEMPKNILIISDMEFNSAVYRRPDEKLFKTIGNKYNRQGYKLPKLIFWNVNSRTGAIPLKENDLGVALVSGFSTNIAEMIMNDKLDPLEILLDKLNAKRYAKIGEILKDILK